MCWSNFSIDPGTFLENFSKMSKIPRCKCILVGDGSVGKSSILQRFLDPNSAFNEEYRMTQGAKISFKQVQINNKSSNSNQNVLGLSNRLSNNLNLITPPAKTLSKIVSFDEDDEENQNDVIELYIYDIGGKQIYEDLLKSLCNNTSMVIGVFDVAKSNSLDKLKNLLDDLMKQFQTSSSVGKNNSINEQGDKSSVIGVIIGNKIDQEALRSVKEHDAQTLAKKHKFNYFECSAKKNIGIEEVFTFLSTKFLERFMDD